MLWCMKDEQKQEPSKRSGSKQHPSSSIHPPIGGTFGELRCYLPPGLAPKLTAPSPASDMQHERTHARRAAFPMQCSSRPPLSMLIHHLNRKPADGRPAYSYCAARNDFVAPDPSWTVPAAYHVDHPADASASGLGKSSGLDQGVAITM